MNAPVCVVLKGYPRLSETFIAEEILGLEKAGFDIRIVALRRPTDHRVHPVHREILAPVSYLPEYLHDAPVRVVKALWRQRRVAGFWPAVRCLMTDLRRDFSRNRVRRFGQALVLAEELPTDVRHLHAHFIHTPASVVRYAGLLTGLPWSASAHAKDIWTSPAWDLAAKLAAARWTVTCTEAGRRHLQALSPPQKPVHLVYHGVKLDRFVPLASFRPGRDGSATADPVRLLTVGRAVEKKGFDTLLQALALLPPTLSWQLTHIGGGPALGGLRAMADSLGLAGRLHWLGPQDQVTVLDHYRQADLFVLPCRVTGDGDRDGLPNVLVEAQSQGLACVSTTVGGIPELIVDGINGLLVAPDDPNALSLALLALARDPERRRSFGRAGQARVRRAFDAAAGIVSVSALLRTGDSPAEPDAPRRAAE